jgi:hypothetical protein
MSNKVEFKNWDGLQIWVQGHRALFKPRRNKLNFRSIAYDFGANRKKWRQFRALANEGRTEFKIVVYVDVDFNNHKPNAIQFIVIETYDDATLIGESAIYNKELFRVWVAGGKKFTTAESHLLVEKEAQQGKTYISRKQAELDEDDDVDEVIIIKENGVRI